MKEAGVEIIYWGGLHTEAGLIIRQAKDQGLGAKLVSGDGIVNNELAAIAGDAVEGTLNTFGPDPTLRPENKDLVAKFVADGFNPEAYTLYSYAAMQSIAGAAAAAGSNDPEAVAAALKSGTFNTVLGDLGYDEKGDPKLPGYVMYEWRKGADGKFNYIQM
jgi:branched-chain amino acid transport system substrate-binding protein